jgi:PGF-CTERM protein
MKSTMKLMVAALVVVALLAVPAMARPTNLKQLEVGDVAFVYETNLEIDTAFGAGGCGGAGLCTAVAKFGNDCPDPAAACTYTGELSRIPLNPDGTLSINAAPPYFGTWYPIDAAGVGTIGFTFQIQRADVTLDAVLNNSHTDSIATKSVTRDNLISFKLVSNYAGNYYKDNVAAPNTNYAATVNIELTTPGGGKIQVFGNNAVDLRNINLTGSVMYSDSLPVHAQAATIGGVGQAIDLTGVEAGTYTATAKWASYMPWYNQESNSNAVTFTVLSKPITITTNKESVVRGNSFVVTITGESKSPYYVYIKNTSVTSGKNPPFMAVGQAFVNQTVDANGIVAGLTGASRLIVLNQIMNDVQISSGAAGQATEANVTTAADGTRAIQFNTNTATDDRKFTIKVLSPSDLSKYDQVDVSVEKGQITITYEGAGTYYLGETVKITGTNTDNKTVYLAIKGPNLNDGGQSLADIFFRTDGKTIGGTQDNVRFKMVDVNTDNTWSYKWDTSKLNQSGSVSLDAGTYTLYAVSDPVLSLASSDLANHIYQTASVVLKKPFVTASTNTNTLAKGDILYIRGTAEGKPTNVYIWTFGKNYRSLSNSASVRSDATFEYKLDRGDTSDLYAGQYFVVVQHPMMNGIQDIIADASGTTGTRASVNPAGTWKISGGAYPSVVLAGLQASDAATALVDLLNSANVDDTYTKLSFMIEEPWIRIDTIGDKYVGDTFKITGTTNVAEGDTILMTVTSSSFQPTEKTQTGEFSGASGSVTVQKGDTYNTFSFDVDASTFKPDEYLVKAESIEPSQSTTTTFNVLEGQPTTVPTTERTPIITIPETPIRTTEAPTTVVPTTTAKPQPGFGALVALVGLGAVALLVLRRH